MATKKRDIGRKETLVDTIKGVKDGMIETLVFPMMMATTKVNLISISPSNWVNYYLAGSAIVDVGEMLYRGYAEEMQNNIWRPYSCFEKHVFYDAPKFLWGKVFGGGEK